MKLFRQSLPSHSDVTKATRNWKLLIFSWEYPQFCIEMSTFRRRLRSIDLKSRFASAPLAQFTNQKQLFSTCIALAMRQFHCIYLIYRRIMESNSIHRWDKHRNPAFPTPSDSNKQFFRRFMPHCERASLTTWFSISV